MQNTEEGFENGTWILRNANLIHEGGFLLFIERHLVLTWAVSHLTLTPWRQRWHGVGSWRAAPCSSSWGSLVWCPHAPTAAQRLWATTTQYSRHCIPTTSSTTYMLHKHLKMCKQCALQWYFHKHASWNFWMPKCHSDASSSAVELHKTPLEVCVPGGEELNKFVCLLVSFIGCIFKVHQVIRGHKGQISNTAHSAAATQTSRGRVGGRAQARVHHWRGLPLSQEIRCI